jgi:hypothetical protein
MHGGRELVREEQETVENEQSKCMGNEMAGWANRRAGQAAGQAARIVEVLPFEAMWMDPKTSSMAGSATR